MAHILKLDLQKMQPVLNTVPTKVELMMGYMASTGYEKPVLTEFHFTILLSVAGRVSDQIFNQCVQSVRATSESSVVHLVTGEQNSDPGDGSAKPQSTPSFSTLCLLRNGH